MRRRYIGFAGSALAILFVLGTAKPAAAEPAPSPCNVARAAVLTVSLPAHPFAAIPSADGCTIYVSLMGQQGAHGAGAIAVLKRSDGLMSAERAVKLDAAPSGMALTHDGTLLIAASGDGVTFLDTARMGPDDNPVLGHLDDGGRNAIYVAVTPDDRFVFVSDERSATLTAIDLTKARSSGFGSDAIVGQIPVGRAPVGLAFSPDGHVLYSTSEVAPPSDWPGGCKPEGRGGEHHQGAIIAVDVLRAESDPAGSVLRRIPGGCNPVRVALSPAGDRLYATARDSNALLVFDTAKLLSGAMDSLIASITVGASPVGVLATGDGTKIIVTNSDRFSSSGRSENQTLCVVDAAKVSAGADAVLGTVEVGGFPRELRLTADGKTLLVTNFGTNSLSLIDLARLPLTPK
jgi:DNA-binding beta-propeller fold protein YncE